MVAEDEKWILYHNITRKQQWVPKREGVGAQELCQNRISTLAK